MTSLSIVIVSYKCWSRLDACLKSIQNQKLDFLEIIVVDNHSNDGQLTNFIHAHPGVHFIAQEINGGFAQACNKGASLAKGDWLLFLNPDTILEPHTLDPLLIKANAEPSWKLIGIKQWDENKKDTYPFGLFLQWWNVWPPIRSLQRWIGGDAYSKKKLSLDPVSFPDWISGSFVLIRNTDFIELGGWDERYWMYCEDMDLSRAAYAKGWKRVMYNELYCMHSHGGSSRINPSTKAITKSAVIISTFKYINKHMQPPGRWIAKGTLFCITLINLLIGFPFSSVKRQMLKSLLYFNK